MRDMSATGLIGSAFSLAAFFSRCQSGGGLGLGAVVLGLGRFADAVELLAIRRLAAANSALALASPWIAASTIERLALLVGRPRLAIEPLELLDQSLARRGDTRCQRWRRVTRLTLDLGLGQGPLGHEPEDVAEDRAFTRISGSDVPGAAGAVRPSAFWTGIVRKDRVLTRAHSGRNSRGAPGRAPRPSSACR